MSSFLMWSGWIIGVAAGCLQIYQWRRERRFGPAKEQLFEEALRDRKGQFTESQIQALARVHGRLERATREEIPRQARVAFLESQLHVVISALTDGVRQHQQLSHELEKLTGMATSIPSELSEAIRSTIKPQGRGRLMRRRVLPAIVALVLASALFPTVSDFARGLAESVFAQYGNGYFTPRRTVSFLAAVLVGALALVTLAGRRGKMLAGKRVGLCASFGLLIFFVGLLAAALAEEGFYGPSYDGSPYGRPEFNWTMIFAACLFSATVSLFAMLGHRFFVSFFARVPLRPLLSDAMVDGTEVNALSAKERNPRE